MAQLVIPKTYDANKAPRVSDLDNIRLSVESFVNSTKLNADNISLSAISSAISAAQARSIIEQAGTADSQFNNASNPTITVTESGVYIIHVERDGFQVNLGSAGAAQSQLTNSITTTLSINAVVTDTWSSTFTQNTSPAAMQTLDLNYDASVQTIKSLTIGDVISTSLAGNITLIKILET